MKFLWRKNTKTTALKKTTESVENLVFPSGRQAIMHTLRMMKREDRLAVAEYSSQCVFNSVASHATPIPIKEVIENNINVDAVMIYEQWGWSFSSAVIDEVLDKYHKVVFDCVDSPNALIKYRGMSSVIVSLSKCLGLKGGAFLLEDGKLQKNTCINNININIDIDIDDPDYIYMINSYVNTIDHIGNLSEADIFLELNHEADIRNKNLKLFSNSVLSKNWPDWMHNSIDDCSAGIVPLFKDMPVGKMIEINKKIKQKLNIESVIYNFNWSGSPLVLDYKPCIAFPIHGDVNNIVENIEMLEGQCLT